MSLITKSIHKILLVLLVFTQNTIAESNTCSILTSSAKQWTYWSDITSKCSKNDILHYEVRKKYDPIYHTITDVINKFCDFDKQIIILDQYHKVDGEGKSLQCVYIGFQRSPSTKE